MSDDQLNPPLSGADEIAGAVRRVAKTARAGQARTVRLFYDRFAWDPVQIAEMLEVTPEAVRRLVAADGIRRCAECAFSLHRGCAGDVDCECTHAPDVPATVPC